jgi:hypothetical protein
MVYIFECLLLFAAGRKTHNDLDVPFEKLYFGVKLDVNLGVKM